jgi:hypothetical protein
MTVARLKSLVGRLAVLAAALVAAPALAAAPAPAASALAAGPAPDPVAWVTQGTDLQPAEVVMAGPQIAYSLELLGPRLPTGEAVGYVRAETAADVGAPHGVRSWDAHVLFDCKAGRFRVMRSTGYPAPNRRGQALGEAHDEETWISPARGDASARWLAAACDPAFAWPLRTRAAIAAPPPAPVQAAREGQAAAAPAPLAEAPKAAGAYAVQLARGPYREGAERILRKAQGLLDPQAGDLSALTQRSVDGERRRYTAILSGFPSHDAARDACATLARAGVACLVRRAPSPEAVGLAKLDRPSAAPPARPARYAFQTPRPPIAGAAARALDVAHPVLGPAGRKPDAAAEAALVERRRRYAAILAGRADPDAPDPARRTLLAEVW